MSASESNPQMEMTPDPPVLFSYSNQQATEIAKQWMRDNYGIARELDEEARDRYHEKLGFLMDFLHTLFPSTPNNGGGHIRSGPLSVATGSAILKP